MMNKLILSLPPSINHMYVITKVKGKVIKVYNKKANNWYEESLYKINLYKQRSKWKLIDDKVIVNLNFYYPDRRRRDSHNMLKILLDVFEEAGIYTDDKLALPRIINYEIDKNQPRVEIEFELYKGDAI